MKQEEYIGDGDQRSHNVIRMTQLALEEIREAFYELMD